MKATVHRAGALLVLTFALSTISGCSSSDPPPPAEQQLQLATGSTCPDMAHPPVTYSGWGQSFFSSYCTRCHSSTLTGQERSGAPMHANWDDLPTIRAYADEIDSLAAGGPNGINHTMPPSDPEPTDDERVTLGEFLACNAPE